MMNSPIATLTPVVEDRGLKLVEEDDVAFTLALSREVHRLYGCYQDGSLPASESVWAGLDLSRRMTLMLRSTVRAGMPALRLEVMAAQTREMLAVLFGEAPSHTAVRGLGSSHLSQPAVASLGSAPLPTDTVEPGLIPVRSRLGGLRPSVAAVTRVAMGLVLCVVVAVAIDVPIAVMALFPSDLSLLIGVYGGIAVAAALWRHRRSKGGQTATAGNRSLLTCPPNSTALRPPVEIAR